MVGEVWENGRRGLENRLRDLEKQTARSKNAFAGQFSRLRKLEAILRPLNLSENGCRIILQPPVLGRYRLLFPGDSPPNPVASARVVVVGGGAAGFFAAIAAAEAGGGPVVILEKSSHLLAKVKSPAAAGATSPTPASTRCS